MILRDASASKNIQNLEAVEKNNFLTKGPSHPPNNSTTTNPNIYDSKVNFRRKIQFFKAKINKM